VQNPKNAEEQNWVSSAFVLLHFFSCFFCFKITPQNPYPGSMVVSESEIGKREEEKKWLAITESEPRRRLAMLGRGLAITEAAGLCQRVLGEPAVGSATLRSELANLRKRGSANLS
jgi:hypothetical protein